MKVFITLSLLVAVVSAGVVSPMTQHPPFMPVMPLEELEGRITNGELAKPAQFPYQVGLSLAFGNKSFWCGGTLISDRWVLTVAHCTNGTDGVIIYLGATDIKNPNEEGQQTIYTPKANIVVHAGWDPMALSNDISLIKMPVAIEFNNLIQPATLPKKDGKYSSYEGNLVWASGWGKDSDSAKSVSPLLRYIEVPVLKKSSCQKYYLGKITDKHICIKTTGKKSTCDGDSGGPLVYKENGKNYVIGATAFGIVLCEKGWPAVFTRVTSYLDWIKDISDIVNE